MEDNALARSASVQYMKTNKQLLTNTQLPNGIGDTIAATQKAGHKLSSTFRNELKTPQ